MGERWLELGWLLPRDRVESASESLFNLECLGVQEDNPPGTTPRFKQPWDTAPPEPPPDKVLLRAWWPEDNRTAKVAIAALAGAWGETDPGPQWRTIGEEDWGETWKTSFSRLIIADNLAVAPPWEAQPGDVVIEPGMAFGTGDHPTTRACLEGVARLAREGARCLDVGCGSGVLALAAAKLGMEAWGVDIDPVAVAAARDAAAQNGLTVMSRVRFDTTPIHKIEGVFELVVANLFAEVLVNLSPHLLRCCGESLVLAGILADRAGPVEAAFASLRLVSRRQEGDWVHLEYRR